MVDGSWSQLVLRSAVIKQQFVVISSGPMAEMTLQLGPAACYDLSKGLV